MKSTYIGMFIYVFYIFKENTCSGISNNFKYAKNCLNNKFHESLPMKSGNKIQQIIINKAQNKQRKRKRS